MMTIRSTDRAHCSGGQMLGPAAVIRNRVSHDIVADRLVDRVAMIDRIGHRQHILLGHAGNDGLGQLAAATAPGWSTREPIFVPD